MPSVSTNASIESMRAEDLRRYIWPNAEKRADDLSNVYALLDAARDERIYSLLRHSSVQFTCLYRGKTAHNLAAVAPYLVALEPGTAFTEVILQEGWGSAWGVFLHSQANLEVLANHFRRFTRVQDEAGKALYFRFYDPRVLRVYLPTCNAEEGAFVFGPVTRFWMEDEDAGKLLEFAHTALLPHFRTLILDTQSDGPRPPQEPIAC